MGGSLVSWHGAAARLLTSPKTCAKLAYPGKLAAAAFSQQVITKVTPTNVNPHVVTKPATPSESLWLGMGREMVRKAEGGVITRTMR